jgi:hypothetical protein
VLYHLIGSWNANFDDTLDVTWSTAYVGYTIHLAGSARELPGIAHYFTDTDPFPRTNHYFTDTDPFPRTNRDWKVLAHRVACKN